MSRKPPRVTPVLAARHEALWLRMTALHAQVAAIAHKRPTAKLPEATRVVAEGLLSDAYGFGAAPLVLAVAALDHGGLLTQLGQAMVALEIWESGQTGWHGELDCLVWLVEGAPLPVKRLRPKLAPPPAKTRDMTELRAKLAKRIAQKEQRLYYQGYDEGLAAGRAEAAAAAAASAPKTYPRIISFD